MKINNGHLEKILAVYRKQGIEGRNIGRLPDGMGASKSDRIELSAGAREFHAALQALGRIPDIREDRVQELRARIASGSYNVSAEEVADRMIESLFINSKV